MAFRNGVMAGSSGSSVAGSSVVTEPALGGWACELDIIDDELACEGGKDLLDACRAETRAGIGLVVAFWW